MLVVTYRTKNQKKVFKKENKNSLDLFEVLYIQSNEVQSVDVRYHAI